MPSSWQRHMAVNLRAPLVLTQGLVAGLPEGGAADVVNLIDERVLNLSPHYTSYTVSKAGLWVLTRHLALALAPRVRVNAIAPGPVLPPAAMSEEAFAALCRATPLGRGPSLDEICRTLRLILAAPAMTGQMITLDGGRHLGWLLPQAAGARRPGVVAVKVALFTQDMSGGTFGAVFSGLANALAANGVAAIELLTVQGDMRAAEHPFPPQARHVRLAGGGSAGAIWPLRRHLAQRPAGRADLGPDHPQPRGGRRGPPGAAAGPAGWCSATTIRSASPAARAGRTACRWCACLYRFADVSFAVSPAVREEVIEVARLDPARVGCIPNVLPPLPPPAAGLPASLARRGAPGRAGVRDRGPARAGQEPAAAAGRLCRGGAGRSTPGC